MICGEVSTPSRHLLLFRAAECVENRGRKDNRKSVVAANVGRKKAAEEEEED